MKKTMIVALLVFSALIASFAFTTKQASSSNFTASWFTLNPGGDETDPDDYTPAPGYDPEQNGCDGSFDVCAVLTNAGNDGKPLLDISGGQVVTGQNVSEIARTTEPRP